MYANSNTRGMGAEKGLPGPDPSISSQRGTARLIMAVILVWTIITLAIGCSLLSLGIFLYFNRTIAYPYLDMVVEIAFDIRILMASAGSFITISSLLGAVGCLTKRKNILQVYGYTTILSLSSLCGTALFLIFVTDKVKDVLLYSCLTRLKEPPPNYSTLFGDMESRTGCCGCEDPTDYTKLNLGTPPATCYTQGGLHDMGCLTLLYQVASDNKDFLVAGHVTTSLLLLLIAALTHYFVLRLSDVARALERRVTPTATMQQNWVSNMNAIKEEHVTKGSSSGSKSSGFWSMGRRLSRSSLVGSIRSRASSTTSTNSSRHSTSNRVDMSVLQQNSVKLVRPNRISLSAVNQIHVQSQQSFTMQSFSSQGSSPPRNNPPRHSPPNQSPLSHSPPMQAGLKRAGRNTGRNSNLQSDRRTGRVGTPYVDF